MDKKPTFLQVNSLLDAYEQCLTDKQKRVMEMKYRLDLSLAEISENLKVSRSGVLDMINEAIKKLLNLEKNINYIAKKEKILEIINKENTINQEIKNKIKGVL